MDCAAFPAGLSAGLSVVLPLWMGNGAIRGKTDKEPFECRSRRGDQGQLSLLPCQTAAWAKSTLEVQPRNTAVCPPVDFTSLQDLRVVATVSVFSQGYKKV